MKADFLKAVLNVERYLSQFDDVHRLTSAELQTYDGRFAEGWEVPELCPDDMNLRVRVLLSKHAPFEAPRIAVAPAPPLLSWPHLEEHGLLCLLPESAQFSVRDPASVVQELLLDTQKLVQSSLREDNAKDFEDEFESYWSRWKRTLKRDEVTVICRPEGPSRMVRAWHWKFGSVVAEDERTLRSWLTNRHGKDIGEADTIKPVPLLWLRRPLRPREYPTTAGALRAALSAASTAELFDVTLLDTNSSRKFLLLGFTGEGGAGFAAVRLRTPDRLNNGFRGRPPKDIVLARYNAATVDGLRARRYDASWVHGRDHNPDALTLSRQFVVIVGIGSIGSTVAELLAKAGVGRLALIDKGAMDSSNSSRHALGARSVGENKAKATARELAARFPHLTLSPYPTSLADIVTKDPVPLCDADLVISTTGDLSAESLLNALFTRDHAFPPVLYGWTEPYAAAGHATAFFHGRGCLRCLLDDIGRPRLPITNWPPEGTMKHVPACGGQFQPYGAVELAHVHAMIAELSLDVLLGRVTCSSHRAWVGSRRLLERSGGSWNPAWIAVHGDRADSGQWLEVPIVPDVRCPECSARKK